MTLDSELIELLKQYTGWTNDEPSVAISVSADDIANISEGKTPLPIAAKEQALNHCAMFDYLNGNDKKIESIIQILKNPCTFFYGMAYEIESLKISDKDKRKDLKDDSLFMYGKTCRYCGKKEILSPLIIDPGIIAGIQITTFNETSHAIPEMIGNHSLISINECDKCNHVFEQFENDFGYFTKQLRTSSGIKGKDHKQPILSHANEKIRFTPVNLNEISLEIPRTISALENRIPKLVKHDKKSGKKVIEDNTRYIPINVYKALVKMALAVIPAHELPYFRHSIDWLLGRRPDLDKALSGHSICSITIGCCPSPIQHENEITIKSFKRKLHYLSIPYRQFCIAFANASFQIALPLCTYDAKHQSMTYPAFTGILPRKGAYGDSRFTIVDFSSPKKEQHPPITFRTVLTEEKASTIEK